MGAAGAQSAAGAASGGAGMVPGGFRDPYSTNQAAYAEQQARGADTFNRFMRWVNQSPDGFERASRGRIVAELMPLLGPNDIGRAQATGTDAFNQAQGQYWENLNTAATQRYIQDTTPHVAGSAPMMAPSGSTVPFPGAPQYEMGGRMLPAGGMPASGGSDSQEQASTGPKVGAKVREPDGEYSMPGGKTVTVKNGQITAIN